jgi:hypothetical protein
MSDGVMFDMASAQRLVQSTRLVEQNPTALYHDLTSPVSPRPIENSTAWELIFMLNNRTGYRTIPTTSVMYTLLLSEFLYSFVPSSPGSRQFRIHSFKINFPLEQAITDWIMAEGDDIHQNIIEALKELPCYDERTFSYKYRTDIAQFTFGTTQDLNIGADSFNTYYNRGLIEELRYVEYEPNTGNILSAPTDAYYINPFYFFESNAIIPIEYFGTGSGDFIEIVSNENYVSSIRNLIEGVGVYGFAIGFPLADSLYLVPNRPNRIMFPVYSDSILP